MGDSETALSAVKVLLKSNLLKDAQRNEWRKTILLRCTTALLLCSFCSTFIKTHSQMAESKNGTIVPFSLNYNLYKYCWHEANNT
jgi:hypothetical protein